MPNPRRAAAVLPTAQTVMFIGDVTGYGSNMNAVDIDVPTATLYPTVYANVSAIGTGLATAYGAAVSEAAIAATGAASATAVGLEA